jgi:hypothetical protein
MHNRASRNELPSSKLRGIHPKRFNQNRLKPLEKIIPVEIGPKYFPLRYSPANVMVQRTSGINASVAWHVASTSFNPPTRNSYFHTPYTRSLKKTFPEEAERLDAVIEEYVNTRYETLSKMTGGTAPAAEEEKAAE